ncbi:MAG: sigma-70 family RNA polymerase sigma factor [Paracoccaceae bacterium]
MTSKAIFRDEDPGAGTTEPAESPRNRKAASDDRERRWAEAMRAASRGDSSAYARLLAEIAPMIRGMARSRLQGYGLSPDEAEDVVQEALIGLHRKRHTWDADRPILPWIRAIATYKLLDAARRLGRTRRATAARPVEDYAEILPAPMPEHSIGAADIRAHVEALPPRERGVVTALVFEGASVSAVARRLGVGPSAVRVAFHRALARLRRAAEDAAL